MGRTLTRALSRVIDDLENVSFSVSASAGALTIALKDFLGNDPTPSTPLVFGFRNATLINGNPQVQRSVIAATSVVVPSTSTCGFLNATAARLWIIGWDDAGTFRLGVFNASNVNNIFPLVEGIGSSLQVVAAGNAAGQHYTAGAAVTSKAFRILGYVDWNSSGVATAGTWTTTNLNSIVTFGPGIRRPGEVVQSVSTSTTTVGTTASATYVALTSGLTQAITPTNAANPIYVLAAGGINLAATSSARLQLSRGTTAATNLFGSVGLNNNTGGLGMPATMFGFDLPNTVSSTTYAVQGKTNASTINFPNTSDTATIVVQELMG